MVMGVCAVGVCGLLGRIGVLQGGRLFVTGMWGLPGVEGSGPRVMGLPCGGRVRVFVFRGDPCCGARGCARWASVDHFVGGGGGERQGVWGAVCVRYIGARVRSQWCACVVLRRTGG